ncbi:MAG: hypothetical protein WCF33_07325, partial [Pseudonocardiaceae bacterium]
MPARRGVQEVLAGIRERRPEPVVRRRRDGLRVARRRQRALSRSTVMTSFRRFGNHDHGFGAESDTTCH